MDKKSTAKQVPIPALMLALLLAILSTAAAGDTSPEVVTVRPAALASLIDELAGRTVRVRNASVVGVLNPRAFLIESATSLPARLGTRNRILVLIDNGAALRIGPAAIVGSNVVIFGVARTLLGVQVTNEVPWPPDLTADNLKRLEVRAAILATSIQTADGVELTDRATVPPRS